MRGARPESILPHRPPMLLVDKVTSVRPGRDLAASWRVPPGWPILAGHFPSEPVVPGVLLVEAIAQASALLAHATDPFEPSEARMYLLTVERARFRLRAGPGDRLVLHASLVDRRGSVWRFEGSVERAGARVAEARIAAALLPGRSRRRPGRSV